MVQLSVIMGVYNIEHLDIFDAAIGSILGQSEPNFELIICDDGSTDQTPQIIERYAEMDSRICVIHNESNMGLAATLNRCIFVAQGEYIARQDADDLSNVKRFEKQLKFLKENPDVSFVGSNIILVDGHRDWGERCFPEFPERKDFLFTQPFVHGALMFRRSCLEQVDYYRVSKETRRTEDYDLLMRIYAQGMRGANLQEMLYKFMENPAAMRRRKYRYRIDEAIVRWKGFCALGLMPYGIPYVVKPMIVGLIPKNLLLGLKEGRTMRRLQEK